MARVLGKHSMTRSQDIRALVGRTQLLWWQSILIYFRNDFLPLYHPTRNFFDHALDVTGKSCLNKRGLYVLEFDINGGSIDYRSYHLLT
jgi:hypothetical protein